MHAIHAIVETFLEATLAKRQNIYIGSKAGNERIERAIPIFMSKLGVKKDQATAIAIRLESLGRLKESGQPINKPKRTRGKPIPVAPLAVATAIANLKKRRTPSKTIERESLNISTTDIKRAKKAVQRRRKRRR